MDDSFVEVISPSGKSFESTSEKSKNRQACIMDAGKGNGYYQCEQCGKSFMENTVLKRHIKRHTMEKAVACNICGKMINNKGALENHIKIHTGEKSNICP